MSVPALLKRTEIEAAASLLPVLDRLDTVAATAIEEDQVRRVLEGYAMVDAVAKERGYRDQANRAEAGVVRMRARLGSLTPDGRKAGPGRGRKNTSANGEVFSAPLTSQRHARHQNKALAKVGEDRVAEIADRLVKEGVRPTPGRVLEEAKPTKAEKAAAKEAEQARRQAEALAKDPGPDGKAFHCTCEDLAREVGAGTLDAIFTDPPYVEAGIPTYSELAAFAVHALRPGGLVLTMASHIYLPETLRRMEVEGLRWRWIVALVWQHNREQFHASKVSIGWKPLLAYTRDGGHSDFYSHDSFRAPPRETDSQDDHPWGQSVGDCRMIASEWLRPGWKVADPFCGSGSLMVAAKEMGCGVVGCDVNEAHVARTRQRLASGGAP